MHQKCKSVQICWRDDIGYYMEVVRMLVLCVVTDG
jgi:hypothetical protein